MYLLSVPRAHRRLDLPQAIAHEQGSVDQHAIGRAVDFEVAEQDVGTEEGEDLVDAIVGLAVGSDVHARGVRGKGGQGVCGATSASAQRQNREVPYTEISQFEVFALTAWAAVAGLRTYHGDIAVLQEDGVVCLEKNENTNTCWKRQKDIPAWWRVKRNWEEVEAEKVSRRAFRQWMSSSGGASPAPVDFPLPSLFTRGTRRPSISIQLSLCTPLLFILNSFIMSDYEDDMDVDAPSKDLQFGSDNASGKKRTAADLPVEAQDNLPW